MNLSREQLRFFARSLRLKCEAPGAAHPPETWGCTVCCVAKYLDEQADKERELLETVTQTAKNRLQRVHELEERIKAIKEEAEIALSYHEDQDYDMTIARIESAIGLCRLTPFVTPK